MRYKINETHDPELKSWVESANAPQTDFPIQNLPLCTYWPAMLSEDEDEIDGPRLAVAIGDKLFDIGSAFEAGLIGGGIAEVIKDFGETLPGLILRLCGVGVLSELRQTLSAIFRESAPQKVISAARKCLLSMDKADFDVPFLIIGYTDFYSSIFHATNVGSMFRPDNPLLPNYKYVPIAYHGRASSIVISGTGIKRPYGQNRSDAEKPPVFVPSRNLDYEMELGFFVGKGNEPGVPIPLRKVEEYIAGVCLVNDWSARDIQAWEYQPLGPFLAKNFATTVSPFMVTMEALAPFQTAAFKREEGDPAPLDYLNDMTDQKYGGLDINLEVYIQTAKMRKQAIEPFLLSRSNTKDLYWTIGQMLVHHSSNGCNLEVGDLIASGTVSGREKNERGCLLELTWRGTEPIELPSGESRRFLEDGDEVIMKGFCEREGFRRIGFGECRGRIIPAGGYQGV